MLNLHCSVQWYSEKRVTMLIIYIEVTPGAA
jgi:hypothetical protein